MHYNRKFFAGSQRVMALTLACIMMIASQSPQLAMAQEAPPSREAALPDVLVIDDFENGLAQWEAAGAGELKLVPGPKGGQAMQWTSATDGLGHITLRNLQRNRIDFSQYDQLVFRIKVEGKPIWNINPIIHQAPHGYGYRTMYYSIDTMHPFDQWYTFSQNLQRWENAWPDTFDPKAQEFQFEVHQLAGPGQTRILIDDIRLMKNPLGVQPSYPARWSSQPDGAQVSDFDVQLHNRSNKALTLRATLGPASTIKHFTVKMTKGDISLAPGEKKVLPVQIIARADVVAKVLPGYGETAQLALHVQETPGLVLTTDLVAGVGNPSQAHPAILSTPQRMRELQAMWADESSRKQLDRYFSRVVAAAENSLEYEPAYPPLAATGIRTDAITGGKLVEVDVPNLPFKVYQDPISGRAYSGDLYDAGMLDWQGQHMANASNARQLAMGYLVTGREDFAKAAAAILNRYAEIYLDLPIVSPAQAGPVGSATSGAVRIGSSFMRERVWLENLAIALDSIRPAGVLTDDQVLAIGKRVFEPSANLMMDHKVGVMNLQWMIQGASLYAGIAADLPAVSARALHDRHGIVNLVKLGFLPDGQWWENSSYQNVTKLVAFPVLGAAISNGMLPWEKRYEDFILSSYNLYGPDGRGPTLGTGGPGTLRTDDTGAHIFSAFVTDPKVAWILHNRPPRMTSYNMNDFAMFRQTAPSISKDDAVDPTPDATVNFPHYGGVAMRVPGTDRYCYFHYGRELTHGHRNKLSINAYGAGGWYVRNVAGGYQHRFSQYLETIASSTSVVVDGQNADTDTGELLFLESTADAQIASAREVGAWKNVEHERTVVLTAGPLIVIDRLQGDATHTYDWLYQNSGTRLTRSSPALEEVAKDVLGDSSMYEGLQPLGRVPSGMDTIWNWKDGGGMRLAMLPAGDVYVHQTKHALGGGNVGLMWRQQGQTLGFAAAYLPFEAKDADSAKVTITSIALKNAQGGDVSVTDAQAYRITWQGGRVEVLVRYTDVKLDTAAFNVKGDDVARVQVRMLPPE